MHYEQLRAGVIQHDLLIDNLIYKDVKLTASNDDYYFVFEDFLYQVSSLLYETFNISFFTIPVFVFFLYSIVYACCSTVGIFQFGHPQCFPLVCDNSHFICCYTLQPGINSSLLVAALFVFDAHVINMSLYLASSLRSLLVYLALW
ncbi:hypothetical protein XENOCAPTIV_024019 [Xenoophorus captivus]|uniref:Uncharacterized protein n=1 Tax=Xenoophorus captivus TaxID=1517983 RepID=A0ABV0QF90_9TELE